MNTLSIIFFLAFSQFQFAEGIRAPSTLIPSIPPMENDLKKIGFDFRVALAGGMAGGISTAVLLPIDTFKTMQQTDKTISSPLSAYKRLVLKGGLSRIYSGFLPAVFGSIISSSIYFGTYEWSRSVLNTNFNGHIARTFINMMAAASGNIMSSFIFVPKDAIKQQIQGIRTGSLPWPSSRGNEGFLQVAKHILKSAGVKGFYPSYRATLMRNIPSAIIKFTIYEEMKVLLQSLDDSSKSFAYLAAGAFASCLSSAVSTPFDVVKTRLATGILPPQTPVLHAMRHIAATEGVHSLFAGAQARMLMSGLFGGIGFLCFEQCKDLLGVPKQQQQQQHEQEKSLACARPATGCVVDRRALRHIKF